MQNQKQTITNLIVKGKTEAALEQLLTALQNTDDYNDAVLLNGQYNDLARKNRLGVISSEQAALQQNKIVSAMLELTNQIKSDNVPPTDGSRSNQRGEDTAASKRKRLALVIGCAEYEHGGVLDNPINDARAMQQELEALGFIVSIRENPSLREFKMAIDDFGTELQNFDEGLFYFAGHGVQVKGKNYLIPVDANLKTEQQVEYDCVRADRILMHMEKYKNNVNIVILDACRNNPFERSWNRGLTGRGLASMSPPEGSLIAFATSPDKTASDGKGDNGLFTGELIKTIDREGITINQMFQQVRKSVKDISNGQQIPWELSSLTADYYFNP